MTVLNIYLWKFVTFQNTETHVIIENLRIVVVLIVNLYILMCLLLKTLSSRQKQIRIYLLSTIEF